MGRMELSLYTVNHLEKEALLNKLEPIIKYGNIKKDIEIFHTDSQNIMYVDIFISYDSATNLVRYKNSNGEFKRSATGWYFYDGYEADKIRYIYNRKLLRSELNITESELSLIQNYYNTIKNIIDRKSVV